MKLIKTAIRKVKNLINSYDRLSSECGGVLSYSYADAYRGSYM